jgi:hypothetical protein
MFLAWLLGILALIFLVVLFIAAIPFIVVIFVFGLLFAFIGWLIYLFSKKKFIRIKIKVK